MSANLTTDQTVFGNQTVAGTLTADNVVTKYGIRVSSNPLWEDMRVPLNSVAKTGTTAPDFVVVSGLGGIALDSFGAIANKEYGVYFSVQFPHGWKAGTEIRPHVHIMKSGTAGGYVVFGLEYTWANVNDKFPVTSSATSTGNTIYMCSDLLPSGAGDQYRHYICGNATTNPGSARTSITYPAARDSSMLVGRLFRARGANGDTLAEATYVMEFDIHIQKDSMGSLTEYSSAA
eukprot:jgi/Mesvir1/5657/Mv15675-RA.1